MVVQASTYMNIDMAGKKLFTKKGLFDEMTALTKVALYQHVLKAAYQGSCGNRGNDYQVQQTGMDITRHWNVQSTVDHQTTSIKIFS